jgi:hypothetical protein
VWSGYHQQTTKKKVVNKVRLVFQAQHPKRRSTPFHHKKGHPLFKAAKKKEKKNRVWKRTTTHTHTHTFSSFFSR